MNYALAKELKDAGFPRGPEPIYRQQFAGEDGFFPFFAPTLSELIEGCGERIHYLTRLESGLWSAGDGTAETVANGSTPTEAVARLWLALQPATGKGDTRAAAVKDLLRKTRSKPHANGDASA